MLSEGLKAETMSREFDSYVRELEQVKNSLCVFCMIILLNNPCYFYGPPDEAVLNRCFNLENLSIILVV